MTIDLRPTPDLIATARRAAGRDWTVDHRGPIELQTNPHLAQLVAARYVELRYVDPDAQLRGQDDYWHLTDTGRQWLADHDKEQ